jgi:transposase
MSEETPGTVAFRALRAYEASCEAERRRLSTEHWGHPGASVPGIGPTAEGRIAAMDAALADVRSLRARYEPEPHDSGSTSSPD